MACNSGKCTENDEQGTVRTTFSFAHNASKNIYLLVLLADEETKQSLGQVESTLAYMSAAEANKEL